MTHAESAAAATFNVVLNGASPNVDLLDVRQKLAGLFKAAPEQVDRLLKSPGFIVKRGLPYDTALKYRNAIEAAGGQCALVEEVAAMTLEVDLPDVTSGATTFREPRTAPEARPVTNTSAAPLSGAQSSAAPTGGIEIPEAWQQAFVGKKYDYYRRKWEIAERSQVKLSWNWAGLLAGPFWLAYRKMYRYAGIVLGVIALALLLEEAMGVSGWSTLISLACQALAAWQGNAAYQRHMRKKLNEISTRFSPDRAPAEIERAGGTSTQAAIGFVVLWVGIVALISMIMD